MVLNRSLVELINLVSGNVFMVYTNSLSASVSRNVESVYWSIINIPLKFPVVLFSNGM